MESFIQINAFHTQARALKNTNINYYDSDRLFIKISLRKYIEITLLYL